MAQEDKTLIDEAVECCEDYTPKTYLGMCRVQQNQDISFARARFTNRQVNTEQVYWDYMEDNATNYYPSVMCDPCAKAPIMSVAEQFERRYAKPFILKNRATVTCGEVKHKIIPPDLAGSDGNQTWLQQFRDYMAEKTLMQSRGFDRLEDDLAWELMITQRIVFPETEYLPDGLTIQYPRNEELNHSTTECFGKEQCDTLKIVETWLNQIYSFNDDIRVTDILMHWETWQDMRSGADIKECLKSYNPNLFLGQQLLNVNNLEPVLNPRGVNLVYTDPNGIRYWAGNIQKRFKTSTGATQKYDMFPKNKLLAFDLSGGENSYQPEFIYTPIMSVIAALEEPEMINSARYAKTYTDHANECWERRLTSNLMVALRCPNSSSELTLCAPRAEATVTPAPAAKAAAKKDA